MGADRSLSLPMTTPSTIWYTCRKGKNWYRLHGIAQSNHSGTWATCWTANNNSMIMITRYLAWPRTRMKMFWLLETSRAMWYALTLRRKNRCFQSTWTVRDLSSFPSLRTTSLQQLSQKLGFWIWVVVYSVVTSLTRITASSPTFQLMGSISSSQPPINN